MFKTQKEKVLMRIPIDDRQTVHGQNRPSLVI